MSRLAVYSLIALNTIVFILWRFTGLEQFMVANFLVSWSALLEGRIWTLLTSAFSHMLFLHFLINMLVLQSFGTILESILGPWRFLRFYIIAGLMGSLGHSLASAFILGRPDLPALGASGAVSGVVLTFSLLFPKEKILLFGLIPVPAIFGAIFAVCLDLWGLSAQSKGHGLPIGHGAHLGGALAGLIYFIYLRRRIRVSQIETNGSQK